MKSFLFLNLVRQPWHSFASLSDSDWSVISDSVSEEDTSDPWGVIDRVGDASGDVGESRSEETLEAGVMRLLLLGLSGVKNKVSVCGGGQDWGLQEAPAGRGGEGKLGETVLPLLSNIR